MEQFLGLSRDASREKSEAGTSPYARNIVFDKQLGSITQENGFVQQESIRGLTIGVYSTNTHIVYITYLITTDTVLFSYVDTNTKIVTEVLETKYFDYSIDRPIEIVAWYNYNQELLIIFSDGVFEKSSAPRIINLMDIGVELDINKEFLNKRASESTLLFSMMAQPRYDITYGNRGNHDTEVVFFTIAYILPDGITRTRFIGTLAEGFPIYAFGDEFKRDVSFNIKDLDPFFTQFVIGIIAYRDNALFAYKTNPISYNTTDYTYNFTGVSNLTSIAVEEIVIETQAFTRVKTLTIGNDSIIVGGLTNKITGKYQKYANLLKLRLFFDDRQDNRHQAPLLCPDEVYYFTIALAFNNGAYSEEYHIPGPTGTVADVFPINKVAMGLQTLDGDIPSFRVINKGGWKNPSVGLPDFNNLDESELDWGYWQNEEVYPNNENYNSLVDYDGTTSLINGTDLRGMSVRLHRVPGLDNLSKKIPMRIGMDIKNEDPSLVDFHTRLPAFSLQLDNFLEAFDSVINSDNIVGYRLSFVKKDSTSKLVEDINFIKPLIINDDFDLRESAPIENHFQINERSVYEDSKLGYIRTNTYKYYQFGFSIVKSINMSVYKASNNAKIIKANFGVFNERNPIYTEDADVSTLADKNYRDLENGADTKGTIGMYANNIGNSTGPLTPYERLNFNLLDINHQYAVVQSIEQVAGNNKDKNNLFNNERIKIKVKNNNANPLPTNPTLYDFGWNPLKYNPTSSLDYTTGIIINSYDPRGHVFRDYPVDYANLVRINLCSTLLNIKQNVHEGLQPEEFVIIGHTNIENNKKVFKDFGDTFSTNIYNEIVENYVSPGLKYSSSITKLIYLQQIYSGMLAIDNNTLVSFNKDKILGKYYNVINFDNTDVAELLGFNYTKVIYNKPSSRQLNKLIGNVSFNFNKKVINKLPFRIAKSLTLQTETLDTYNIRTFLANAYYDMPSIRGEIIALTGFDKGVYCQQRYSLSIFQLKEKLSNNDDNSAYLAETDLFAYKPQTIIDEDNKGYIGSVHQFGRKLTKYGLLIGDAERGKVYLIAGATPNELSKIKISTFFMTALDDTLNNIVPNMFNATAASDNPYNGNGIIFGIDDRTNRILITISNYRRLNVLPDNITFNNGIPYKGNKIVDIKNPLYTINKSKTLSYNLDWKRWIAEHDYLPQFYINTNRRNYAGTNSIKEQGGNIIEEKALVYITNEDKAKTGKYFYDFDNKIHESYIDLLFNSRYDLSKWYKSIMWRSTVKDINDNNIEEATINAILLYTDYQCSGRIELDTDVVSLIRNSEGLWSFNSFRDLAKNGNDLPIRKDGSYDEQKVFLNRNWFDKSDIISNFIIVRLIMNNIEDTQTHIHNVNTEARTSDRI